MIRTGTKESVEWGRLSHEVSELIDTLEEGQGIESHRVARLEWQFLPLLDRIRTPRVPFRTLAEDPEFFVETLKLTYKAHSEEPRDIGEMERSLAMLGHRLLDDWNRLPGLGDDEVPDPSALREWVLRARAVAREADRFAVADIQIGYVLVHSPAGSDALWPHEGVRQLIEEVASEDIERAIAIGIQNQRGVFMRVDEGGTEERELAERYRRQALALGDEWPHTARILRAVAASYDSDARRADTRAIILDEELLG